MESMAIREKFAELARDPAREFDLLEACLLVAAEDAPGVDLDAARRRIRALRDRLAGELTGSEDYIHAAWALRQVLCVEWGMRVDGDAAAPMFSG